MALGAKDWLTEQVEQATTYELDWSSAPTTYDIAEYIMSEQLQRIRIYEDTTDEEAQELITDVRSRVIPMIEEFMLFDQGLR